MKFPYYNSILYLYIYIHVCYEAVKNSGIYPIRPSSNALNPQLCRVCHYLGGTTFGKNNTCDILSYLYDLEPVMLSLLIQLLDLHDVKQKQKLTFSGTVHSTKAVIAGNQQNQTIRMK